MATPTDLHATKRRLLDAAGPVFAAAGYEGASLRAISARAKANLAAVKYHFGSKHDLYEAVLREAAAYARERHPYPDDAADPPEVRLTTLVRCVMRRVLDRGRPAWHARLMSREMADPSPAFGLIAEQMARPLLERIEAAVAALMPGAPAAAIRAHAHSVSGQCLFHRHAAPLLRHLYAGSDPADRIDEIAAHIARFSLTAIGHRTETPMTRTLSARTSLLLIGAIAAALLIAGWLLWPRSSVSTDDAFIEAPVVPVASEVAGTAVKLLIADNQLVAAGDPLVEIDTATWAARSAQAAAAHRLALAERTAAAADLAALRAAVDAAAAQAVAEVAAADAETARARADSDAARGEDQRASAELGRQERLQSAGVASAERLDQARATGVAATSSLASAGARIAAAEAEAVAARSRLDAARARASEVAASAARVERADAAVAQAAAAADEAAINLRRTRITAPVAGRVTRRGVEAGGWVQAGQTVLWLVPDEPWVVANFPESDLARIRPGQAASIEVDAYPGVRFAGKVDSVQSGSGSRFALLPAENATGNFVKVVQRVPVKITFDQRPDPSVYRLGPGMSAVPEVRLR